MEFDLLQPTSNVRKQLALIRNVYYARFVYYDRTKMLVHG